MICFTILLSNVPYEKANRNKKGTSKEIEGKTEPSAAQWHKTTVNKLLLNTLLKLFSYCCYVLFLSLFLLLFLGQTHNNKFKKFNLLVKQTKEWTTIRTANRVWVEFEVVIDAKRGDGCSRMVVVTTFDSIKLNC